MMEWLGAFIKSAPMWLQLTTQVIIILLGSLLAFSTIAGMWVAMCAIKRRQNMIAEIEFFPPKISFHPRDKQ